MVGRLGHVHIHLAGLGAFPAGDALAFIHLHLEQGYLVQQGIDRTQGTEPLAEGAIEHHTQYDHPKQDAAFPSKERTQCRSNTGMDKRQRDRPLQHALRAEVLAEEGVAHPHIVHKKRRHQAYHPQQNCVFQIRQWFELLCGALFRWDLVQQLLKPTEGTQKAAEETPQQNPHQQEETCDIIGKAKLG